MQDSYIGLLTIVWFLLGVCYASSDPDSFDVNLAAKECFTESVGFHNKALFENWKYSIINEYTNEEDSSERWTSKSDKSFYWIFTRAEISKHPAVCFCMPYSWNKQDILDSFKYEYKEHLTEVTGDANIVLENKAILPYKVPRDGYFWVGVSLMSLIFIFWILGLIVQYTSIGNIKGSQSWDALEKIKSKTGLFFLSWSPAYNLKQLFETSGSGGGQKLNMFNGIRTISSALILQSHIRDQVNETPYSNFQNYMYDYYFFNYYSAFFDTYFFTNAFFFISGFLSLYVFGLKQYPEKGNFNFLRSLLTDT